MEKLRKVVREEENVLKIKSCHWISCDHDVVIVGAMQRYRDQVSDQGDHGATFL